MNSHAHLSGRRELGDFTTTIRGLPQIPSRVPVRLAMSELWVFDVSACYRNGDSWHFLQTMPGRTMALGFSRLPQTTGFFYFVPLQPQPGCDHFSASGLILSCDWQRRVPHRYPQIQAGRHQGCSGRSLGRPPQILPFCVTFISRLSYVVRESQDQSRGAANRKREPLEPAGIRSRYQAYEQTSFHG